MANTVVKALKPHTNAILEAKNKYSLEAVLAVVLTFSTHDEVSTPAIGFDAEVISFLNSVQAYIDVDTYIGTDAQQ